MIVVLAYEAEVMNEGHKWIPRVLNPLRCPKCLTYDWEEKQEVRR